MKKLMKSDADKKVCGVCGGIGEYFGIDPTVIRVIWLIFGIVTGGAGFVAYLLAAVIIPSRNASF